jgi:hypothetical protein
VSDEDAASLAQRFKAEARIAEVSTLYETNASEIPAILRQAAKSIEEEPIKAMIGIAVDNDGGLALYGWGQTDSMDTLATLQLAIVQHANAMLGNG